jgi:tRNA(fMet)-specific endonuclease VapC
MKAALIDTNILSLFFRGHPQVVGKFETYLKEYEAINLSIITYYEIVSGLKHRDAHKQLDLLGWFKNRLTLFLGEKIFKRVTCSKCLKFPGFEPLVSGF